MKRRRCLCQGRKPRLKLWRSRIIREKTPLKDLLHRTKENFSETLEDFPKRFCKTSIGTIISLPLKILTEMRKWWVLKQKLIKPMKRWRIKRLIETCHSHWIELILHLIIKKDNTKPTKYKPRSYFGLLNLCMKLWSALKRRLFILLSESRRVYNKTKQCLPR